MKAFPLLAIIAITVLGIMPEQSDAAVESRKTVERELKKVRGGIVYKMYCVLCHGEKGDGESRALKLYGNKNLNLAIRSNNKRYIEKIVRKGGKALGKSSYMPRWDEELSEEQIQDVVHYLDVVDNQVRRGEVVFKGNCILCHGVKGDGNGRASKLFDPPPADLTRSDKNDEYKRMIIRYGGAAMGRSDKMPIWGEQLSEQEISDVVRYLRTLLGSRR